MLVLGCGLAVAAMPTLFEWRGGSLSVPSGFQESVRDYKEGVVIALSYPDGSEITLQQGGMMQDPHPDADQIVARSDSKDRLSRRGVDMRSGTFWRLDSYKQKLPKGTSITWLDLFPPKVGYHHVPKDRKAEFDKALNTFELRKRTQEPRGR